METAEWAALIGEICFNRGEKEHWDLEKQQISMDNQNFWREKKRKRCVRDEGGEERIEEFFAFV